MTTRSLRLAIASMLALAAAPGEAAAQGRRGGMVGNVGNNVNRANFNQPNINRQNFNRQNFNINQNNFNRQNINQNNFNRQDFNQFNNRTNINSTVINNRTNVVNNVNRGNVNVNIGGIQDNRGYGGGWGGYGGGYGGYRPGFSSWGNYGGYHSGWVNGSWNGGYGGGWGGYNPGNSALGVGAAVGLAAYGVGSLVNSWGYARYSNPYYAPTALVQQPTALVVQQPSTVGYYDYSRPLDPGPVPSQDTFQAANATFDSARQAFLAGDYAQALARADRVLTQTPNDPILHEFRAICLFARRRFDEAAAPLYTVLSAGPGFDWTTLIGLYPDVEVYTAQLRALEAYCNASPRAASARFVLAALYLTQGSNAAAAVRLREVVAIQPTDRLSAQLLAILEPPSQPAAVATAAQPAAAAPARPSAIADQPEAPPLPTNPVSANLLGAWVARPAPDVAITLTLGPGKAFGWKVDEKGQAREFKGDAGMDDDVLALTPPEMPPMVGKVTWKDAGHFKFKALGTPAEDPGLEFAR